MKIAIEGCCHGELDAIYKQIAIREQQNNYKVDLLLICGDFQAIRNHQDLQCMAVPNKFRQLGGFYRYYTGETMAPVLTVVIGGNHEASNYLWELYHGGWLAPNIYYLGHAGCVQVNGVRIAGASGIWKFHDFRTGFWEKIPYTPSSMRSAYHIREFDVRRLSLLSPPKVFLSHDWPVGIEKYGNVGTLLRKKPFFREDVESGKLGSPPLMGLLQTLKPEWWFAAHLHVRFVATVIHGGLNGPNAPKNGATAETIKVTNPDEILIDEEDEEPTAPKRDSADNASQAQEKPLADSSEIILEDELEDVAEPLESAIAVSQTQFIALDKCLPNRQFLEIVDLPSSPDILVPLQSEGTSDSAVKLCYDPEWLAITRAFHPYMSLQKQQKQFPLETHAREMVRKELDWVLKNVVDNETGFKEVTDCQCFVPTAPGPGNEGNNKFNQPPWYTNPQTEAFCQMLGLENKVNPVPTGLQSSSAPQPEMDGIDTER